MLLQIFAPEPHRHRRNARPFVRIMSNRGLALAETPLRIRQPLKVKNVPARGPPIPPRQVRQRPYMPLSSAACAVFFALFYIHGGTVDKQGNLAPYAGSPALPPMPQDATRWEAGDDRRPMQRQRLQAVCTRTPSRKWCRDNQIQLHQCPALAKVVAHRVRPYCPSDKSDLHAFMSFSRSVQGVFAKRAAALLAVAASGSSYRELPAWVRSLSDDRGAMPSRKIAMLHCGR